MVYIQSLTRRKKDRTFIIINIICDIITSKHYPRENIVLEKISWQARVYSNMIPFSFIFYVHYIFQTFIRIGTLHACCNPNAPGGKFNFSINIIHNLNFNLTGKLLLKIIIINSYASQLSKIAIQNQ